MTAGSVGLEPVLEPDRAQLQQPGYQRRKDCLIRLTTWCVCVYGGHTSESAAVTPEVTLIVETTRHCVSLVRGSPEIVLLYVVSEGPKTHTEELGRFHLDTSRALERLGDVPDLDLFDVRLEIKAGVGQRVGNRRCGRSAG